MRMTHPAFAAVLLLAVPSVSFAQIVVAYGQGQAAHVARLDHVVPVATVTPPGDGITLDDPRPGVDFVLGAAQLDIRDTGHPMILFAVSNRTEKPIPPGSVDVHVASVCARSEDGAPMISLYGYSGLLSTMLLNTPGSSAVANATLAPGATLTMAMPAGPSCSGRPNVGFLVRLTSDGSHTFVGDNVPVLRRAFEALISRAQQ